MRQTSLAMGLLQVLIIVVNLFCLTVESSKKETNEGPEQLNSELERLPIPAAQRQFPTLNVTTVLTKPYVQLKLGQDGNPLQGAVGNDRFEGFGIDLLNEIAEKAQFQYSVELAPDGKYGAYDEEKKGWNGMIGELIKRKADLAIADLTITSTRSEAVDFTVPFMSVGISILYTRDRILPPPLFGILRPFSASLWLLIIAAYLVMTLLLYVLAKVHAKTKERYSLNSAEGQTGYPNVGYTLYNSCWFTSGILMRQGWAGLNPKSAAVRIVILAWWLFTLFVMCLYIARLNSQGSLGPHRISSPFTNAEELSKQDKVSFGCVQSGSTASFFQTSSIPVYKKLGEIMLERNARGENIFAKSNSEGLDWVRNRNGMYAFFMESSTIEYLVARDCDLQQVGGLLDNKGYGIALPKGSPWKNKISEAILRLTEDGVIAQIKNKWWSSPSTNCVSDSSNSESAGRAQLDLSDTGGLFIILLLGIAISLIVAIAEFVYIVITRRRKS